MRRPLAMLAACLLLTAAGSSAQSPSALRAGVTQEPNTLDPIFTTTLVETDAIHLLFDGLVRTDASGNLVPDLAREVPSLANGGISRDGRTLTYHLVSQARFTDGRPVTSADVKFTYEALFDPKNGVPLTWLGRYVAAIDAPDPLTVIFRLRKPYAPMLLNLTDGNQGGIVPAHLLRGIADLRHAPFGSAPVGSGPYRLIAWRRGERMEFAANPSYFRGAPKIERIEWRFVENDNTLATQLRTRELDLASNLTVAPFIQVGDLPGMRKQIGSGSLWEHLTFNLRRPQLADVRVRRALCSATDLDSLLAKVAHGLGTLSVAQLQPGTPYYDRSLRPCPYDPARAGRLLDEAGWKTGEGGIRVKNGERLALTLSTVAGFVDREQTVVQLQNAWRAIGVEASVKTYPAPLYFAPKQNGGIVFGGQYDVALFAYGYNNIDPAREQILTPAGYPPDGTNVNFYDNPAVSRLEFAGAATFDPAKRKAIYDRVQQLVAQDVPYVTLRWRPRLIVADERLSGIRPSIVGSEYWNVTDWRFGAAKSAP